MKFYDIAVFPVPEAILEYKSSGYDPRTETFSQTGSTETVHELILDYLPKMDSVFAFAENGAARTVIPWTETPTTGQVAVDFSSGRVRLFGHLFNLSCTYTPLGTALSLPLVGFLRLWALNAISHINAGGNVHGLHLADLTDNKFLFNGNIQTPTGDMVLGQDGNGKFKDVTATGNISGCLNNSTTVGTQGNANGRLSSITTWNTTNTYGRTTMQGATLYQSRTDMANDDTTNYQQVCGPSGMPQIYKKTPADSSSIDMGDVFTTGQRCTLVQNGYCIFSGLSSTAFYFNPLNGTYASNQVWSGNTSYFSLDTATVAVAANDATTPKTSATAIGDRRVKILVAGKYKITGTAKYLSSANANFYMRVLRNRVIRDWWDSVRYYGAYPVFTEVLIFDCLAGDLITLEIYSGGQTSIETFQGSISIERIG